MKISLVCLAMILASIGGCITDGEGPSDQFGSPYVIIQTATTPNLSSDSLVVTVGYSGCNGGHEFSLQYRIVSTSRAEVWLYKVSPAQLCRAYFVESKRYALPEAIHCHDTLTLVSPQGLKLILRALPIRLYGKWNWLFSVGGFAGHTLRPPPAVRVEYYPNGSFFYYRSDTLVATTSFTIRREKTILSPDTLDVIHYLDSLRFLPQAFQVDRDTLRLTDVCIDCYYHVYERIR
ncbi:MAG: hypothetical protein HY707_07515 [Ignavibacteriae bacterium]|nr:hypothetical protein [Ignavibacteriota bacterium]